jgi:hypothetical protein
VLGFPVIILLDLFLPGFSMFWHWNHLGYCGWLLCRGLGLTFCVYLKSPKAILERAESPNRIHTVV